MYEIHASPGMYFFVLIQRISHEPCSDTFLFFLRRLLAEPSWAALLIYIITLPERFCGKIGAIDSVIVMRLPFSFSYVLYPYGLKNPCTCAVERCNPVR